MGRRFLAYVHAVTFKAQHLVGTLCVLAPVAWALTQSYLSDADAAERLSRARALRSEGKLDRAEAMLLAAPPEKTGERSTVLGVLGRISLDRGDLGKAKERLEQALQLGRAAGLHEQALDDALALAYLLSELRNDFVSASRVLVQAQELADRVPAAQARLSYQRGLLAFDTGELGAALHLFRAAGTAAANDERTRTFAAEMEAFTLASLGRPEEVLSRIGALRPPEQNTPCERMDRAANRGFLFFLSYEATRHKSVPDPRLVREMRVQFERAEHESKVCDDPQRRKNAQINLGLLSLIEGDRKAAGRHLRAARALSAEGRELLAWELELEGRLALADSDPVTAERTFRRSADLSQAVFDQAWSYRALWGLGDALRARGQLEAASQTFELAELTLDELLASGAPLSLDQSAFLASRDGALRSWLELLLLRGDVSTAHALVRRALSRAQRQAARTGIIEALPQEQRQRMQRELGTYRALRAELDAEARDDWRKSARALAETRARREALEQRANAALDRAYSFERQQASTLLPVPSGLLELTYFPGPSAWLVFAATSKGVRVERTLPFGEAATSPLFAPFEELIRSHQQLAIHAYGQASAVDFHALPFEGKPLLERHNVVYPLEGGSVQPGNDEAALVLVDPAATFEGSASERHSVYRALSKRGQVRPATPTRTALLSELERTRFFHFGGHALAAPYEPLSARLILSKDQALSVADVLSLARAPAEVVLAACESGTPSSATGPAGLSLAAAFVARGAQRVVGTVRPVSNRGARALVESLYGWLDRDLTFSAAFLRAQRDLVRDAPELDAAAFRLWTHATEHSHDTQPRCEACVARRELTVDGGGLRAAAR